VQDQTHRTIALEGPRLAPAGGRTPRQLVVLCHGVGADGEDMLGLAGMLRHALPETEFVCPHAPFPFDFAPTGRQWFPLLERTNAMIEQGVRAMAPVLARFFAAECARLGLPHRAGVLAGFSQGAMMALFTGLRMADPPGALAGFSGALPGLATLPAELKARPPVLLVHGERDEVVAPAMTRDIERALRALGVPVHALYRPELGHSLDDEGIGAFAALCADLLERRSGPSST
jgi:phospholipase/carboxylesterase